MTKRKKEKKRMRKRKRRKKRRRRKPKKKKTHKNTINKDKQQTEKIFVSQRLNLPTIEIL